MKVNELKITYIEKSHQELSDVEQRLLKEATQAAQKAYAPYSHFRVGAAVKLANGEILSGSNQENAAYPSGLCAERVAVYYANARYPQSSIETLLITAVRCLPRPKADRNVRCVCCWSARTRCLNLLRHQICYLLFLLVTNYCNDYE